MNPRLLPAALLVVALLAGAACGGDDDGGAAVAADVPAADVPAAETPATEPSTARQPAGATTKVPDVAMTDVVSGEQVSPRSFISSGKPVLYWFWAPH